MNQCAVIFSILRYKLISLKYEIWSDVLFFLRSLKVTWFVFKFIVWGLVILRCCFQIMFKSVRKYILPLLL